MECLPVAVRGSLPEELGDRPSVEKRLAAWQAVLSGTVGRDLGLGTARGFACFVGSVAKWGERERSGGVEGVGLEVGRRGGPRSEVVWWAVGPFTRGIIIDCGLG